MPEIYVKKTSEVLNVEALHFGDVSYLRMESYRIDLEKNVKHDEIVTWYHLVRDNFFQKINLHNVKELSQKGTFYVLPGVNKQIPVAEMVEFLEAEHQNRIKLTKSKNSISPVTPEVGFFAKPKKEKRETTYTVNQTKEVENG
ncbi:MAG: hypothetical protein JNL36_07785 [Candidatus Kapabacteria bacterium]|nr:hypothetical protein [Candidatus Kapabacteria bacterium]